MNLKRLKYFIGFPKIYGLIPTSYQTALSYEEQLFWLCNELVEFQSDVQTALLNLQEQVQELIDSNFVTPEQLQTELSSYLPLIGGTMNGDLNMNGHTIRNAIIEGGGGGTSNYNELENKPSINLHTLVGNTTLDDINVYSKDEINADFLNLYNNLPYKESEISSDITLVDNSSYIPLKDLKILGNTERTILLPSNVIRFKDVQDSILLVISETTAPSVKHEITIDLLEHKLRNFIKQDESVVYDEISGSGNLWYLTQRIGYIASYDGEFISTEFESSTGTLSTGAEVRYLLETPVVTQLESSIGNALASFMKYDVYGMNNSNVNAWIPESVNSVVANLQVLYYLDLKTYLTNMQNTLKNYNNLENKPQINDVTLIGNKSLNDLGIASNSEFQNVKTDFYNSLTETLVTGTTIQVSNALPISIDYFNLRGNFDLTTFKPVSGTFDVVFAETSSAVSQTFEIDLGELWLGAVNTTYDSFSFSGSTIYLNKKIGYIESYNGETITTDYVSSTGSLTTGAEVYYVLSTPEHVDISSDLQFQLNNIIENAKMYESTTISTSLASVSPVIALSYFIDITSLIPNVTISNVDLTEGTSSLQTGSLYFYYET